MSKYKMIVELARGGMGDVFLAVSRGPGGFHKLVVIKELRTNLSSDSDFLTMFMEEARLSARLHHPNIVQTNEVGQEGDRYFMAMEYLEGQTLNRCAQKVPRDELTADVQMHLLVEVLAGLHYAHELADYDGRPLNIVHRDISPHNILVTYDGQPKILDFGIAKTRDSHQQTATGALKGKVPYMAPEQLDRSQDRRTDVFAVGVMLWEAIAGRRLWAGKPDVGIVQMLAEQKIPHIREGKPDVPEALERIVSRALAPDPANRYPTAQDFANDLEAYIESTGSQVSQKQIGKMVAKAFAKEREQIRALIDEQLQRAQSADSDSFEAAVAIPRLNLGQSGEMTPSGEARARSSDGKTPAAASMSRGASTRGGREGRRARTLAAVIGGTAIAVLALLVVMNARSHKDGAQKGNGTTVPSIANAQAAPSPAAPPAATFELSVAATPKDARIFVDDAPVSGNPFITALPRGGTHVVRAEAAGFESASETRTLDRDLAINLVLERAKPDASRAASYGRPGARVAPAPPPRAATTAPSSPASPPSPGTPAPAPAPSPAPHTIDPSDPYAK